MSLQYNDENTYKGIVQQYEKECGFERGYISGNTTRLKEFNAEYRITFDRFLVLAFEADGTHQYDDSNHTDYPEIEFDLVSGQRDYSITSDENGNLILDIYRVLVKNTSGIYVDVDPVDKQSQREQTTEFVDGQTVSGVPNRYDKTGTGIIFNVTPNYSYRQATEGEKGVKVLINREALYPEYDATSAKPGVPGLFHEYFALLPASKHTGRKVKKNHKNLIGRIDVMEKDIEKYFANRAQDERTIMTPKRINKGV